MLKTVLRVLFGLGLCTIISGCMIYSSLGLPWEAQNLDGSTSITWRSGGSLLVLSAITQSISFWTFHRRIAQKVLLGLISFVGVAILILQSSFFLHLGAKRSRWHLPLTWRSNVVILLLLLATQGLSFLAFRLIRLRHRRGDKLTNCAPPSI